MGVAYLQRVILEDVKWQSESAQFMKINTAEKYFKKASENLSSALRKTDQLFGELTGEKKKKFEAQVSGFKSQIKGLNTRLNSILSDIDHHRLPKADKIHEVVSLAIAGTGFGMQVSKNHQKEESEK